MRSSYITTPILSQRYKTFQDFSISFSNCHLRLLLRKITPLLFSVAAISACFWVMVCQSCCCIETRPLLSPHYTPSAMNQVEARGYESPSFVLPGTSISTAESSNAALASGQHNPSATVAHAAHSHQGPQSARPTHASLFYQAQARDVQNAQDFLRLAMAHHIFGTEASDMHALRMVVDSVHHDPNGAASETEWIARDFGKTRSPYAKVSW